MEPERPARCLEPVMGRSETVRTDAALDDASGSERARPTSFESFYESTYPTMVKLAWALVDTREAAEEAVQDAYASMYRRFDSIDNPRAYLRTSVVNGCRNVLRRRSVVRRHVPTDVPAATDDVYDHLFDVIRRLPPRHRAVVVLTYQEGLGIDDVAEALGIAPGTVKSRLSRAKEQLRKEIDR